MEQIILYMFFIFFKKERGIVVFLKCLQNTLNYTLYFIMILKAFYLFIYLFIYF